MNRRSNSLVLTEGEKLIQRIVVSVVPGLEMANTIVARARRLTLLHFNASRFELRAAGDRIAASGSGFMALGCGLATIGFGGIAITWSISQIGENPRGAVGVLALFGGLTWLTGVDFWMALRETAMSYFGRAFEIDTSQQLLTVRQGMRTIQSAPFSEILAVSLDCSYFNFSYVVRLSVSLQNPQRELVVRVRRLAGYGLAENLNEIAVVGEAAAALMGVNLNRDPKLGSFAIEWI